MDLIAAALSDAVRLVFDRDPELLRIAALSLVVSGSAALLAACFGGETDAVNSKAVATRIVVLAHDLEPQLMGPR